MSDADGKELTPEEAVPILLREIERLRIALRFYADMENYIQVDQSTVFVPIITVDLQPQLDNGRTARAALGE